MLDDLRVNSEFERNEAEHRIAVLNKAVRTYDSGKKMALSRLESQYAKISDSAVMYNGVLVDDLEDEEVRMLLAVLVHDSVDGKTGL